MDGGKAMTYHNETSHTRWTLGGPGLDWSNLPAEFKRYPEKLALETFSLPEPVGFPTASLFEALYGQGVSAEIVDVPMLSRILYLACGITGVSNTPRGDYYFRGAASAGALHPVEMYCAVGSLLDGEPGLWPGLYHYAPLEHALVSLERQDAVQRVAAGCAMMGSPAPLTFVLSSIFFRSTWKYRARGYRYCLLDCGHVLENLKLALRAEGLDVRVHIDFDDKAINSLLGVTSDLEGALAVVEVLGAPATSLPAPRLSSAPFEQEELAKASRVAKAELQYQLLDTMHQSSMQLPLASPAPASSGWQAILDKELKFARLPEVRKEFLPRMADLPLFSIIKKRSSKRNFVPQKVDPQVVLALARSLCGQEEYGFRACEVAMVVQNVADNRIRDGVYLLRREDNSVAKMFTTPRHPPLPLAIGSVCLGQEWIRNAAVQCLFFVDIPGLEAAAGPRSYRHSMIEAGRLGERVYLAATALGLGACGIGAFFDKEAAVLLGLEDRAWLLYLVACGPVRR